MVEPGRRCLADRYELFELIASGGMGQVWRGRDLVFGRPVAVKVLRSEYTGDPTFLARFRAEAQHAAALSHPHIACVFDYGETVAGDGSGEVLAYLVMELVEGEPLSAVLRREGPLDTATTLRLLRQTGEALGEAHRVGMVHRDVKPGNILVGPDGSVKITDFGIAWSAASVPLTRTGQVIGTPQYLSPEQAEGRQASPASDVYALGLVGYECLAGHAAFDGDNAVTIALKQVREQPEPLPAELPPTVRALIDRTLAKDPERRLPDGAAFVAALEDAEAGRELPPLPPAAPATATSATAGAATVAPRGTGRVSRGPAGQPHVVRRSGGTAPHAVRGPVRSSTGRRLVTVLLPLLALFTGAAIAAVVLTGLVGDPRHGGTPAVAADTGESKTITLVAADYVGHPVDQVAAQLGGLGLDVERVQEVTSSAPANTVVAVDPVGQPLRRGDTVTVSYAVPLPSYESVQHRTGRQQPTPSDAAAPTTPAAPEVAAVAATPSGPGPAPAAGPGTTNGGATAGSSGPASGTAGGGSGTSSSSAPSSSSTPDPTPTSTAPSASADPSPSTAG